MIGTAFLHPNHPIDDVLVNEIHPLETANDRPRPTVTSGDPRRLQLCQPLFSFLLVIGSYALFRAFPPPTAPPSQATTPKAGRPSAAFFWKPSHETKERNDTAANVKRHGGARQAAGNRSAERSRPRQTQSPATPVEVTPRTGMEPPATSGCAQVRLGNVVRLRSARWDGAVALGLEGYEAWARGVWSGYARP
jgi:hypothetical protein